MRDSEKRNNKSPPEARYEAGGDFPEGIPSERVRSDFHAASEGWGSGRLRNFVLRKSCFKTHLD